jgi:hypothetical protein
MPATKAKDLRDSREPMRKSTTLKIKEFHMDVEHINAIGNTLSSLTQRTLDLRGFL